MFIKLFEISEDIVNHNKAEGSKRLSLREIVVNTENIVSMRQDTYIEKILNDYPSCAEGLKKDEKFTRLYMNRGSAGQELIVLGSLDTIYKLLEGNNKKVIKG